MDPIFEPPELDEEPGKEISREFQSYAAWYQFPSNHPRRAGETGAYYEAESEEDARQKADQFNEANPGMEYKLVPVKVLTVAEAI